MARGRGLRPSTPLGADPRLALGRAWIAGLCLLVPAALCAQTPARAAVPSTAESPLADALRTLTRLRVPAELYIYGAVQPAGLDVVAEIPAARMTDGRWTQGAEAEATVTGPNGESVGSVRGRVPAASRGVLLSLPLASWSTGPFRVNVKVSAAGERLEDRVTVEAGKATPLLGLPVVFRAASGPRGQIQPVADFQFRRTERLHVEWPILKSIDRRQARLLGQAGQPLIVEASVKDAPNGVLAVDVTLAPLVAADYVLELAVASGRERERRLMAIRIVQ